MRRAAAALALTLWLSACAPPACQGDADRQLQHDVELVVKDDGPISQAAAERLRRGGAGAIAVVETGFYAAEPPARLRLVRVLRDIGSDEATPILAHLAASDPDPDVRAAADAAKTAISHGRAP
jgi:hypothetical protein